MKWRIFESARVGFVLRSRWHNLINWMGKKKRRNHSTKEKQFKGISKKAAVFDNEERKRYLESLIGAKKRRKEEYMKMKSEKAKRFIREQKQQIREVRECSL